MNEPTEDLGELQRRLEQAEADRNLLAAEVEAWREYDPTLAVGFDSPYPPTVYGRLGRAVEVTDASGALTRAKEDK
jgi:hypothetical protein